jgi:small GTP-binding protein
MPTVGGSFTRIKIPGMAASEDIGLWDTAGQERFRTIVPLYFQRADIILIVFSLESRESFDNVSDWYSLTKLHAPSAARFFLIGNKSDLLESREVTLEEGQSQADRLEADVYVETSAVTGAGCQEIIDAFQAFIEHRNTAVVEPVNGAINANGSGPRKSGEVSIGETSGKKSGTTCC